MIGCFKLFAAFFVLLVGCKSESIHLGESTSVPINSVTESMVGDWGFDPSSFISLKKKDTLMELSWHHATRRMEVGNAAINGDQITFDEVDYSLDGKSYAHEGELRHCTLKLEGGKLIVHCVGAVDPKGNFIGPSAFPPLKK